MGFLEEISDASPISHSLAASGQFALPQASASLVQNQMMNISTHQSQTGVDIMQWLGASG